jgi:hypothetical protein
MRSSGRGCVVFGWVFTIVFVVVPGMIYDCAAGGTPCTKIAETEIHYKNWNGPTANWLYHEITIGSVSRT